jgi:3',5'-cyclic AMP phosphodiesterase CpdA
MKRQIILILSMMALTVVLYKPSIASDHVWKFVVMGDTRDKTRDTETGVSPDLSRIAQAIAAEKPELVLHTGDLCNGYYTTKDSPVHGKFREMFRNWKTAMKPVFDYSTGKGIPVYLVRGNHEDGEVFTDTDLEKAYEEEFAAPMPQNGPDREKGLTYSFTHEGVKFIALDQYRRKKLGIRGYIDQDWLDQELARDKKSWIFAFAHTPAFKVGGYGQSPFPDLYSHRKSRDAFWARLKNAGVPAFFCGHIHLYCRGTIDGIEQIVIGNGGANTVPFKTKAVDHVIRIHYPESDVDAADIRPGYVVLTVDERSGKAAGVQKVYNHESGKWEPGDTFTLTPGAVPRL